MAFESNNPYSIDVKVLPEYLCIVSPSKQQLDMFGVFYLNNDLIISDELADAIKKKKLKAGHASKIVELDYELELK